MQLDDHLVATFKADGWHISIETNGTLPCPEGVNWIVCSPKISEIGIKLERADELKYVRGYGQGIPHPKLKAKHYELSPIFEGNQMDGRTVAWVVDLVKQYPMWRLTIQHHKANFGDMR